MAGIMLQRRGPLMQGIAIMAAELRAIRRATLPGAQADDPMTVPSDFEVDDEFRGSSAVIVNADNTEQLALLPPGE